MMWFMMEVSIQANRYRTLNHDVVMENTYLITARHGTGRKLTVFLMDIIIRVNLQTFEFLEKYEVERISCDVTFEKTT